MTITIRDFLDARHLAQSAGSPSSRTPQIEPPVDADLREARDLLLELWHAIWTYDDYSEVSMPILMRNKLADYCAKHRLAPLADCEHLPECGNGS